MNMCMIIFIEAVLITAKLYHLQIPVSIIMIQYNISIACKNSSKIYYAYAYNLSFIKQVTG
jgi:hypothetical protein